MRFVACLHTAESNIALFEAVKPASIILNHTARAELLREAEAAGGMTGPIATRTRDALAALSGDAVLLTCSTLGPAAKPPAQRVDAALAEAATRQGGWVVVLVALQTTLAPTRAIFAEGAERQDATVEICMVPDAWAAFRAGDLARYHALVAAAAAAEGAAQVALAQASLAPAAALFSARRPLTNEPRRRPRRRAVMTGAATSTAQMRCSLRRPRCCNVSLLVFPRCWSAPARWSA